MVDVPISIREYRQEGNQCRLLIEALYEQLQNQRFCDVRIQIKNQTFAAHKCILAGASRYFDSVFKEVKTGSEDISLKWDNPDVFSCVLNYIYTGIIQIHDLNVQELLGLADMLMLDNITSCCADYLQYLLCTENCLNIWEISKCWNLTYLENLVVNEISSNLLQIIEGNEMQKLALNLLENFLKSYKWNLANEQVFKLITNWVYYDVLRRRSTLPLLLTFIDWNVINVHEIRDLMRDHPLYRCEVVGRLLSDFLRNSTAFFEKLGSIEGLQDSLIQNGDNFDEDTLLNYAVDTAIHVNRDASYSRSTSNMYDTPSKLMPEVSTDFLSQNIPRENRKEHLFDRNIWRRNLDLPLGDIPEKLIHNKKNDQCSQHFEPRKLPDVNNYVKNLNEQFMTTDCTDTHGYFKKKNALEDCKKQISFDNINVPFYNDANNGLDDISANCGGSWKLNFNETNQNHSNALPPCTDEDISLVLGQSDDVTNLPQGEYSSVDNPIQLCPENDELFKDFSAHNLPFLKSEDVTADKIMRIDENIFSDGKPNYVDFIAPTSPSIPLIEKKITPPTPKGKTADENLPTIKRRSYRLANLNTEDSQDEPNTSEIESQKCKEKLHVELPKNALSSDISELTCDVCQLLCDTRKQFYAHLKVHFKGPPFNCDVCDSHFANIYRLSSHRKVHGPDKPFKCDKCDFATQRKFNLREHLSRHSTNKAYQCNQCDSSFTRLRALERHYATHSSEKPFKCTKCDYAARTNDSLRLHQKEHSGELYRCKVGDCKYATPKKSHLTAHLVSHSGTKPYLCSVCSARYRLRSHLLRHERKHQPHSRLSCQHCSYTCNRTDSLKKHMRKDHREFVDETVKNKTQLVNENTTDAANCSDDSNWSTCNTAEADPDDPVMIIAEIDDTSSSI